MPFRNRMTVLGDNDAPLSVDQAKDKDEPTPGIGLIYHHDYCLKRFESQVRVKASLTRVAPQRRKVLSHGISLLGTDPRSYTLHHLCSFFFKPKLNFRNVCCFLREPGLQDRRHDKMPPNGKAGLAASLACPYGFGRFRPDAGDPTPWPLSLPFPFLALPFSPPPKNCPEPAVTRPVDQARSLVQRLSRRADRRSIG